MEYVNYIQDYIEYDYYRITPAEMFKTVRTNKNNITPFSVNYQYVDSVKLKVQRNKYNYKLVHASFDIETTDYNERSYMYIWQFGFISKGIQYVCKGRTWQEFEYILKEISNKLYSKDRIIVWVHNLSGYEFQFMRGRFHNDITEVFAKENNHPIKFVLFGNIEFRDTLSLCPKPLEKLAEDYCTARKLKGDLDYSIIRSSADRLTEEEERYCDNDVIILSQYSEFVFDNYIIDDQIPLTQTGLLRADIKKYLKDNGLYKRILHRIKCQFPSRNMYDLMVNYLFKGGLSNANFKHTMEILNDLDSYDYTSSYPACMLQDKYYYPCEFKKCNSTDFNKLFYEIANTKCVIAILKFENLRPLTDHNFISISKCIEVEQPLVLNGRVRRAKSVTVFETEIDISNYILFYDWDNVEVIGAWTSTRQQMPDYIRIPLLKAYVDKSRLKNEGKPYATEKSKANSAYGMIIQKLITTDIKYNNDTDTFESVPQTDYDKMIKNRFILPQVGIYITAWARHNLLMGIYEYQDTTYFYDTDSIKGHFVDETYIQYYNNECIKWNKILSEKYNVPFEYVADLGCWDCETKKSKYEKFETLGSKRYIYTQECEFHQTVAGLGKTALYDTCYEMIKGVKRDKSKEKQCNDIEVINKCFETFNDNMYINDAEKLNHSTFGYTSDTINGVYMEEFSGVHLAPCEFTLKMKDLYKNYILSYKENQEERI